MSHSNPHETAQEPIIHNIFSGAWSKARGEEQGSQWDLSHLGLVFQSMTVVIKVEKKKITLESVQIHMSLL